MYAVHHHHHHHHHHSCMLLHSLLTSRLLGLNIMIRSVFSLVLRYRCKIFLVGRVTVLFFSKISNLKVSRKMSAALTNKSWLSILTGYARLLVSPTDSFRSWLASDLFRAELSMLHATKDGSSAFRTTRGSVLGHRGGFELSRCCTWYVNRHSVTTVSLHWRLREYREAILSENLEIKHKEWDCWKKSQE
jgi:hypothetical protein